MYLQICYGTPFQRNMSTPPKKALYEDTSHAGCDDIQHALMLVDIDTSRKICKAMRLPEKFADYCGDDRGNVVDFYDRSGKIAELNREAEYKGKYDQSVLYLNNSDTDFIAWLTQSPWADDVKGVPRVQA